MKKILLLGIVALYVSGCASSMSPPVTLITSIAAPITATGKTATSKRGESECQTVLGLVTWGDCSIDAAAKDGGITTISTVNSKVFNVLFIYGSYTTVVTGE